MTTEDRIATRPESAEDALTVEQAAKVLGCSASKLNKFRVLGGGPEYCKLGRSVRYVRRDLIAYRDAHKRRSTSDASATVAA